MTLKELSTLIANAKKTYAFNDTAKIEVYADRECSRAEEGIVLHQCLGGNNWVSVKMSADSIKEKMER